MPQLHWLLIAPIRAFARANAVLADSARSKLISDCVDSDNGVLEASKIDLTLPSFDDHEQEVSTVSIPKFLLTPIASLGVKQATFDFSAEIESTITNKKAGTKPSIDLQCRLSVEKKRRRPSRILPILQCSAKMTVRPEPEGIKLVNERLNVNS